MFIYQVNFFLQVALSVSPISNHSSVSVTFFLKNQDGELSYMLGIIFLQYSDTSAYILFLSVFQFFFVEFLALLLANLSFISLKHFSSSQAILELSSFPFLDLLVLGHVFAFHFKSFLRLQIEYCFINLLLVLDSLVDSETKLIFLYNNLDSALR